MPWLPALSFALLLIVAVLAVWLLALQLRRQATAGVNSASAEQTLAAMDGLSDALHATLDRLDRGLRDEVGRHAAATRVELGQSLGLFQQSVLQQHGETARGQSGQIDAFRGQLAAMQAAVGDALQAAVAAQTAQAQATVAAQTAQSQAAVAAQTAQMQASREAQDMALQRFSAAQAEQLRALSDANERRLADVQSAVEQRLTALQAGNEQKLEQMRATVDEKLHATLEQRLGESFKQVADRLEQVHRGLGEMQSLAKDVGSLNRVLTNVKTRGTFGEVQLGALLEQVFVAEQYAANVEVVPGSRARVDYAIRLPGHRGDGVPLWLPIDAKFPREDYERLVEAQHNADVVGAEAAGKALEVRLRSEARTIREKYVSPPHTTDYALLFVPTEGLYAEALRRPGLAQSLQQDHRVSLVGPTTLLATITALQMGFRAQALERRSTEVWEVLGAVKTEFGKFGEVLAKTKKKLAEASNVIEDAEQRNRAMHRALKTVEALPEARTQVLLPRTGRMADDAADDVDADVTKHATKHATNHATRDATEDDATEDATVDATLDDATDQRAPGNALAAPPRAGTTPSLFTQETAPWN